MRTTHIRQCSRIISRGLTFLALLASVEGWSQPLPVPVGVWPMVQGGRLVSVAVRGDYAYVANDSKGLEVVEIGGLRPPAVKHLAPAPGGGVNGVRLAGIHALVTSTTGVHVFSLLDSALPVLVGSLAIDQPSKLEVAGDLACFVRGLDVHLLDVSDPTAPTLRGTVSPRGVPNGLALASSRLYVANKSSGLASSQPGLDIFDVSDPANPVALGGLGGLTLGRLVVLGRYAYALGSDGLAVLDVGDPTSPVVVRSIPLVAAMDLSLAGSRLAIAADPGVHLFDLGDPARPVLLARVENVAGQSLSLGETVVCLANSPGLVAVDLSQPAAPQIRGEVLPSPRLMAVAAQGDLACVFEWSRGLYVLDTSDPAQPVQVGELTIPSNSNPGHDIELRDGRAYVVSLNSRFDIVDVSNRARPVRLGGLSQKAARLDLAGSYAYLAAAEQGLRIVDVSSPTEPALIGQAETAGAALDVAVQLPYAFVAEGDGGLSIWEVNDPHAPRKVGSHPAHTFCVALADQALFTTGRQGFHRGFDLRDVTQPRVFWEWQTPGNPQVLVAGQRHFFSGMSGPPSSQLVVFETTGTTPPRLIGKMASPGQTLTQRLTQDNRHLYQVQGTGLTVYRLPLKVRIGSLDGQRLAVQFTAQKRRTYVLERAAVLPSAAWSEVGRLVAAADQERFEVESAPLGSAFFRVREE